MALFGKKKEDKVEDKKVEKTSDKDNSSSTPKVSTGKDYSWVIRKPRITEKASILPETANAFIFEVDPRATKNDVKKAVNEIYKVDPVKVNIARIARKPVERRRTRGVKKGYTVLGKKAFVYLKKGEKIEFV